MVPRYLLQGEMAGDLTANDDVCRLYEVIHIDQASFPHPKEKPQTGGDRGPSIVHEWRVDAGARGSLPRSRHHKTRDMAKELITAIKTNICFLLAY